MSREGELVDEAMRSAYALALRAALQRRMRCRCRPVAARRLQGEDGSWDPDAPGIAFALLAHKSRPEAIDWEAKAGQGALAMTAILLAGADDNDIIAQDVEEAGEDAGAAGGLAGKEDCPLIGGRHPPPHALRGSSQPARAACPNLHILGRYGRRIVRAGRLYRPLCARLRLCMIKIGCGRSAWQRRVGWRLLARPCGRCDRAGILKSDTIQR